MNKIVECIPNFSEGRDASVVKAIASAIASVPNVVVLDRTMDSDHHRSVITFAGEPEAVLEAAVLAAARAVELIDLNLHTGEHPRMGAMDVLPFVPIKGVTMTDCVALARRAGERIARELRVPVYLYEHAATRPDRIDLANVRRGEFEGLRANVAVNPESAPDFGEAKVHPTAGAVAVGARAPLIAYNINLATEDLTIAKKIARAIRGRDGGLRYVKALGFELAARNQVQVSMNLVNYEATPLFRVFEMVKREADRYGVRIVGSEIIGLIPQAALNASADFYLQIENFSPDLVLEQRLQAALDEAEPNDADAEQSVTSFVDEVAAGSETPGSGSVAALTGVLAASLGAMVCKLVNSDDPEIEEILAELEELRADLRVAVAEDAESFARVLGAQALPETTEAEQFARQNAIEETTKGALAVPLRVAEASLQAMELLSELTEFGDARMFPELPAGAQLALAAMRGAYYNVCANLDAIGDAEFTQARRGEVEDMIARGQELADEIEGSFLRQQLL
ncbi:MAG: glutamate formimidoyltransferase [Blastocatellia bacterium]|nr:glutamate formimidoyltransferase [Blastocatellia bacterium]